jgi:hypothetical protein
MKKTLILSAALVFILASCVNHMKEEPKPVSLCDPAQSTFSGHVNPIIQLNCAIYGCHDAGSGNGDFTKYEELKIRVEDGRFKNSVIDGNTPVMPPSGKLPDAQIRVLECWLSNGAPNN